MGRRRQNCLKHFKAKVALEAGARVLEKSLESLGTGRREHKIRCSCGSVVDSGGVRTKTIMTLLAPVGFSRSLYRCAQCGQSCLPDSP